MNNLQDEKTFFNEISPKIFELVASFSGNASVSVEKAVGDYATEVDIAVENLIVSEINARFPSDMILAEESHSDTQIPEGRIWIIDPICGTQNIGRGMKNYCTNIALAENSVLIASCVLDHSQNDYIWSIGDTKVYINDTLFEVPTRSKEFGIIIDVDMGSLTKSHSQDAKEKFSNTLHTLITKTDYMLTSLNTSLTFAYAAIGKLDGFINTSNHPWDICASSFLLQQVGGTISDLHGKPWAVSSVGAIGSLDPAIHKSLVSFQNRQ